MSNRREFLKLSGAAVAGSLLIPANVRAFFGQTSHPIGQNTHPIGLQLFTLFTIIDDDVSGNLKKVAAIGYTEIESAFNERAVLWDEAKGICRPRQRHERNHKSHHVLGAPFHRPANAKPMLDANGKPITFPPMRNLTANMQELVDEAAEGGIPYLVCANIPTDTMDAIHSSIDVLNKTGEACKKAGITLCYHNHTGEFTSVDGTVPYNIFLAGLTPDIQMELDLCWATKAGVDPVALFKAHPGRFPLWHTKDLDKTRTGPCPVGTGVVDFQRIFDSAGIAGMKHFLSSTICPADAFSSIDQL